MLVLKSGRGLEDRRVGMTTEGNPQLSFGYDWVPFIDVDDEDSLDDNRLSRGERQEIAELMIERWKLWASVP